jgi:hypothetical protein
MGVMVMSEDKADMLLSDCNGDVLLSEYKWDVLQLECKWDVLLPEYNGVVLLPDYKWDVLLADYKIETLLPDVREMCYCLNHLAQLVLYKMQNLRSWQHCYSHFKSACICYCVTRWVLSDILNDRGTFLFKLNSSWTAWQNLSLSHSVSHLKSSESTSCQRVCNLSIFWKSSNFLVNKADCGHCTCFEIFMSVVVIQHAPCIS